MLKKEIRITVRGVVQGVGFRFWTKTLASQLGVAGSVWNESDGTVTIIAQGSEESLQQLIARVHEGPPSAEVREVVHSVIGPCTEEHALTFEIRR